MQNNIQIPRDKIADFCRRWEIIEFAFFGSVLREDFTPQSDIDVLVAFGPSAHHGIFDVVRMEEELSAIFGRKVDLVERGSVEQSENYIRREHILASLEPVYVA